jgi:hypothetical protein
MQGGLSCYGYISLVMSFFIYFTLLYRMGEAKPIMKWIRSEELDETVLQQQEGDIVVCAFYVLRVLGKSRLLYIIMP